MKSLSWMMSVVCLSIATFLFVSLGALDRARAGFFEVGASGSYKKSHIDVDAYDEAYSLTGSLAYFLTEASALELSYTDGTHKRVISEDVPYGHVTTMFYKTVGLDFVYTWGARDAVLRPYLKGGANYIISKRIVDQYRIPGGTMFQPSVIDDSPGLVPSAGAGFRIGMTEHLSLKVGVDGWSSRSLNKPPLTIDWIGRAGLSWFF